MNNAKKQIFPSFVGLDKRSQKSGDAAASCACSFFDRFRLGAFERGRSGSRTHRARAVIVACFAGLLAVNCTMQKRLEYKPQSACDWGMIAQSRTLPERGTVRVEKARPVFDAYWQCLQYADKKARLATDAANNRRPDSLLESFGKFFVGFLSGVVVTLGAVL